MPNTELFRKIQQAIEESPDLHDQGIWAGDPGGGCGTVRCVAGWAIQLAKAKPREPDGDFIRRYARQRDTKVGYEDVAEDLLGLTPDQSHRLFFQADEVEALYLVRDYANPDS